MSAPSLLCPQCNTPLPALEAGKPECPHCGVVVTAGPLPDTHTSRPGDGPRPESTVAVTSGGHPAGEGYAFLAPPDRPGDLGRLGPYRVLGLLGKGGMGAVFRAEDPRLKRQVALKVMLPLYARRPADKARFLREAQAQAAVEHDHVIPIFQVDEDRGTPFIAMPLLKGQTLAAALRQDPRPPAAEVIRIGREMAEGLSAAHDSGLIHRDIKPGNVWLEGDRRRVKILDFGLARPVAPNPETDATEPLTAEGAVVGTPAYMSPEQARGQAVDARTDLFGLGVVLYQMATGELPFRGADVMVVLTALALDTPVPPIEKNPATPPALSDLILRLLAKDPADRPPSARAVADELRRIEGMLPLLSAALPAAAPADPWEDLTASAPVVPTRAPAARRAGPAAWVWVALGLLVLAGAGLLAQQVIKITTPKGTLVIETDDPAVEVVVKKDGAVIRTKDREIALAVGDYTIELAEQKDGLKLSTDKFTITRDGKERVKVWLVPPKEAAKPKDKPTTPDPDRRAAEALKPFANLLHVRLPAGEAKYVARSDPLPAGPFTLLEVVFEDEVPADFVSATFLPAVADLRSLRGLTDNRYRLRWTEAELARLAGAPAAAALGALRTGFDLTPANLDTLRRFPDLSLVSCRADAADDALLGRLKDLPRLTELGLGRLGRSGTVGEAGWAAVAGLPVTYLKLPGAVVPPRFARRIAGMSGLEDLSLGDADLSDDAVRELAACPKLQVLALDRTAVTDAGLAPLGAAQSLRELTLSGTKVTEAGVKKLAAALPKCRIEWNGSVIEPKGELAPPPPAGKLAADPAVPLLPGHDAPVWAVRFLADGKRVLSTGWDGTVRLWDATTGQQLKALPTEHTDKLLNCLAVSPDERFVAAGGSFAGTFVWDLAAGKRVRVIPPAGPAKVVHAVAFTPDGDRLLAGTGGGAVAVFRARDGHPEGQFQAFETGPVNVLRPLPGGTRVVIGSHTNPDAVLWDLARGREVRRFAGAAGGVQSLAYDPAARRLYVGRTGGAIRAWEVETGNPVATWKGHTSHVKGLHVLPGGRLVSTADDKTVILWDAATGTELDRFTADDYVVAWSDVSPDGLRLAAGAGWRLAQKKEDTGDNRLRLFRLRPAGPTK